MTESTDAKRINELEQRVYRLEQAIHNTDENAAESVVSDRFDRYDTYVLENAETDGRPPLSTLRHLYQEAGIVDQKKIKRRMKRLDQLGAWENE